MRHVLIRSVRSGIAGRPLQTALLGLVLAAAAAAFTLALGLRRGADAPYQRTAEATRAAHVYAIAPAGDADLAAAARLPGVTGVAGPYPLVDAALTTADTRAGLGLLAMPVRPRVDRPRLTAGRWLRPGAGEVVLERSLAHELGLSPGDRVVMVRTGRRTALRVAGLAVTASVGPYPAWSDGIAWTDSAALSALAPPRELRSAIALRLSDPAAAYATADQLLRRLRSDEARLHTWQAVEEAVRERADSSLLVLSTSTLFALIAAGLIVANTIAARVLAHRRDIGILKAVGLTPRQVTLTLLAENVTVAVAAALAGVALGVLAAPLVKNPAADLLGTPSPSALDAGSVVLAVAGVALVVALFTILPAWRAGRLSAVQAIAPAGAPLGAHPSRVARAAGALHLPPTLRAGLKDAFGQRGRTALTVASLAITMATMTIALAVEATFHHVITDSTLRAKPFDLWLAPEPGQESRAKALLRRHRDEIATSFSIAFVDGRAAADGHALTVKALSGGYARSPFAVPDGRMLAGPGEAIVARGLLDRLGAQVGDRLALSVGGRPFDVRIVGRHVEPDDDGQVAIVDSRSLPAGIPPARGVEVAARLLPGADPHALQAELVRESGGAIDVEVTEDEVRRERADLRPALWSMNAVLLAIGIVNLLTTLLLAVRERMRDFGVLKAIGMTPSQVAGAVGAGGAAQAAVALVFGVPLGLLLFRVLLGINSPSDGPDVYTVPAWWWLALLVPGALLLTTAAAALPGRIAASVRPADALRWE